MENSHIWVPKEGLGKNNSLNSLCKDRELSTEDTSNFSESHSQPKKLVKRANSHPAIFVNMIQSQISKFFFKDFFFRNVPGQLDNRIPKNMVSIDEKYLRQCLEFIHVSAFKGSRCNKPVKLTSSNMGDFPQSLYSDKFVCGYACDSGQLIFECPVEAGSASVVISANASEKWTLGTVMGSKSMINTSNSSLFQRFGGLDNNENLSSMNFTDSKGLICYDYVDSPSGFSISSSYKFEKDIPMMKGKKFGSTSVHERLGSTSSTNSTYSEGLSFATPSPSQGMLQCTWREGIPHFVFSTDDQKEVYMAKPMKVAPIYDKALDYVYLFHLDRGDQKGSEISDSNSQLVGKMNVSTSFTLSPNNDKLMETEFVLFGNNEIYDKEVYSSSHTQKKNKGLTKKVSQIFKTSPSSKHKTPSKSGGLNAIEESCPWEPYAIGGANFLEANIPPNLELAAIVVKDHIPCSQLDEVGGWGLKFLNKSGVKQTTLASKSSMRNTTDSTNLSILIPAGLHGGPRTRNGGPSSLIDRWRSGGRCECGGWDEGCPLTVLQRRSANSEVLSDIDMRGECRNVDLVTQPLSVLQSFSIAVAIIHMQSPTLRPNGAQEF